MLGTVLRLPLLAALLTLLAAAPAGATTLVREDGAAAPPAWQAWVDGAAVPTPAGAVVLRLAPCTDEGALGCAGHEGRRIDIDPGWLGPHVLLHELGHVFDDEMAPWGRAAFEGMLHRHDPWTAPPETTPPRDQFAEADARCARHTQLRAQSFANSHSAPTPRRHRRDC